MNCNCFVLKVKNKFWSSSGTEQFQKLVYKLAFESKVRFHVWMKVQLLDLVQPISKSSLCFFVVFFNRSKFDIRNYIDNHEKLKQSLIFEIFIDKCFSWHWKKKKWTKFENLMRKWVNNWKTMRKEKWRVCKKGVQLSASMLLYTRFMNYLRVNKKMTKNNVPNIHTCAIKMDWFFPCKNTFLSIILW